MDLVSIVVVTRRDNIRKIIDNYKKQSYLNKELLILINTLSINIEKFIQILNDSNIDNYQIYQNHESISLGECYNFCITKMNGKYFCKMDDDDLYSENYIVNQLFLLKKNKAFIIGKSYFYLYDSKNDILYSKYISSIVLGGTLIIDKIVFDYIKFNNVNRGEDTLFLKDAKSKNVKILSSDINDFVYIRYTDNNNHHTYNVNIQKILGKDYNIVDNDELKEELKKFILI